MQQSADAATDLAAESGRDAAWLRHDSRLLWGSANQGFSWPTPATLQGKTASDYVWQQDEVDFMRQVSSLCGWRV